MKARVIIEYDLDCWDAASLSLGLVKLREPEEVWLWSATVNVELLRGESIATKSWSKAS